MLVVLRDVTAIEGNGGIVFDAAAPRVERRQTLMGGA
jgi:hypothetical protein